MTKTIVKTCEYCGQEFDAIQKYSSHKRHEHPGWRQGLVPLMAGVNGMQESSEEE